MIRSVMFEPDGAVVIEYVDEADMKVHASRQHAVACDPTMRDRLSELEDLETAAERALKAILEAWPNLEDEEDEAEDVPGYDNPRERERYR